MAFFDMDVEWLPPPEPDAAFGPERATWANLSLFVNGQCLTSNHSADSKRPARRDYVTGGTAGLASWIVDNWKWLLWEVHTPFPKNLGSSANRPPSLRDAFNGWRELLESGGESGEDSRQIDGNELGQWQGRHTLGHGSSSLALPSIVLVPEIRRIGVSVDHLPPQLGPTVRFEPPTASDAWPSEAIWLPKDDVADALSRLVETTLEHAGMDSSASHWVRWLRERWTKAKLEPDSPDERRKIEFGNVVAEAWKEIEATRREETDAIEGLLTDSALVRDSQSLQLLLSAVDGLRNVSRPMSAPWDELRRVDESLPYYEQGYRLAVAARKFMKNVDQPITGLEASLQEHFQVPVQGVPARRLFRSAVVRATKNATCILRAIDDPASTGVAPMRFAVAAALGRLLAEGSSLQQSFGAAHGSQSRSMETQRANAFAAEFLLPTVSLRRRGGADIESLCDDFAISRSAATWHVLNRLGVSRREQLA